MAFYLAPSTSTIGAADNINFGTLSGFTVPANNSFTYVTGSNLTITLPQVDPLPIATSFKIGMVINPGNAIVESNYSDNSNKGANLDLQAITITPPHAVITNSNPVSGNNLSLGLGAVVADGTGQATATQYVTLSNNAARSLLTITSNSVKLLGGTNFHIGNIIDNLSSSYVTTSSTNYIKANSAEAWTIPITFTPLAAGTLTDTLQISTDDPTQPTLSIALSGTGTPRPNLVITDSVAPATDQTISYGSLPLNTSSNATVTLTNNGTGPLTIAQNGISLAGAPFSVTGITSSTQGAISLGGGSQTLAANNAETWTVAVRFTPTTAGLFQQKLAIADSDPNDPSNKNPLIPATVSLSGMGQASSYLSVTPATGLSFGSIPADGAGKQLATQTLTLLNTGPTALTISQNGITFATGTQFFLGMVVSSTQGPINLSTAPATIAANSAESWTVTVTFDPTTASTLTDTLRIASSDVVNPITSIPLSGIGTNQPVLSITGPGVTASGSSVSLAFPATLADGAGGVTSTQSLILTNIGTQTLTIPRNGLSFAAGTSYSIASVVSSTRGSINLNAAGSTLAPLSAETWTIMLVFDPPISGGGGGAPRSAKSAALSSARHKVNHSTLVLKHHVAQIGKRRPPVPRHAKRLSIRAALAPSSQNDTLFIASNDPVNPNFGVTLSGQGVTPAMTAVAPAQVVHVSAGNVFGITWLGADATGNGAVSLYYDTDRNPAAGLTAIVSNLPQTQAKYNWQIPAALVGGTYTIYVVIADGTVTAGAYAAGSLTIDAAGTDRMLSAPVASNADYALTYSYNGRSYNATYTLNMGDNALYPVVNGVAHEYHVQLVPTLTDSQSSAYDSLGDVTSSTDSAGLATNITYDMLQRPVHVSYPDGSYVNYNFDAAGNLVTMQDPSGWQLYGFDALNRLTSVTYSPTNNIADANALTIGYKYDADNRLIELDYPSGRKVQYGYDNASKLTTVTEFAAGQITGTTTTYTYNSTTGLLSQMVRPNNTQTVYTYDTSGRLIDILNQNTSTSALISEYHYTLDASGRQTMVVETLPSSATATAYVYDQLNRLSQVTYSNTATITSTSKVVQYTYDGNGNRLTMSTFPNGIAAGASQVLTYAYGAENRLNTVTDQGGVVQAQYFYDWHGNEVAKVTPTGTVRYTYDARNLLIEVDDGSNKTAYIYDGAGRQIGRSINGIAVRLVLDPTSADYQQLEEVTAGGSVGSYIYGLQPIASTVPGTSAETYFMTDVLGSIGSLTTTTGADTGDYHYDAFGSVLSGPPAYAGQVTFAGEQSDPNSGLIYLRARTYDPSSSRFLQKDPAGTPNGPSRYPYAKSDPVNSVDPLGLTVGLDEGWSLLNIGLGAYSLKQNVTEGKWGWAAVDALGLVYDTASVVVPFLPAGVSFAIKAGRGAGTAIDVANIVKNTDRAAEAVDLTKTAAAAGTAIHRDVGQVVEDGTLFTTDLANYAKGADGATGIKPDFYLENSSNWIDITTAGQWNAHVTKYADFGEGFPILYERGVGVTNYSPLVAGAGGLTSGLQSIFNGLGASGIDPGGVLINQAATLVNGNLKDIAGATFDPTTNQIVFLGDHSPTQVDGINMNYFTTAVQAVYGSAVPPYVTLDPPAKLTQPTFNVGDGNGVILNGKTASIIIQHTPYNPTETDDMTLNFNLNGVAQSVRLNGYLMNGQGGLTVIDGGRYGEGLTLASGTSNGQGLATAPSGISGITYETPAFGSDLFKPNISGNIYLQANGGSISIGGYGGGGYTFYMTPQGQQATMAFSIVNNSGTTENVTNIQLVPDLQERRFGGRVDGTSLGWVMEEADRVMKELAIGKDQLTGATYNSSNTSLPSGFQNVLERDLANNDTGQQNDRFWFTPALETLKRYVDPTTGQATVVFDQSTDQLNTESLLLGQPEDAQARAFVDFFNQHMAQLDAISFPVHDPTDPTFTRVVNVPIFAELRDAMAAVSLARFLHDNNIPLQTWWMNSYQPPAANVPATIPTLSNSISNGTLSIMAWGGVTIKTPNTYESDPTAQVINNAVIGQRSSGSGGLPGQSWTATASGASFDAVAASFNSKQQTGNITLSASDLGFASIGQQSLTFNRYYNSGFLADQGLGAGWQPLQYQMQFQYPSIVDSAGLMRDSAGSALTIYGANSDTEIRSGEIRILDNSTGQYLNFISSLATSYALDNNGNPVIATSGLTASDVPTFTPGIYQNGSSLAQDPSTKNYTLTRPDGSTMTFDNNGNILKTTDALGYAITYTYANGKLSTIKDSTSQQLAILYGSNGEIQYVQGPDASATPLRRIAYQYNAAGLLSEVDVQNLANGAYVTASSTLYAYNGNNQLSSVTGPDGVTTLTAAANLAGQTTTSSNALGDMTGVNYSLNPSTGVTTTLSTDMGDPSMNAVNSANNAYAQGIGALQYFVPGSSSMQQTDSTSRTVGTTDALGNATKLGYNGNSQAPNTVQLPMANRPAITIQRNSANLPTVINDPANTGGAPVQIQYNSANLPTSETDAKGLTTTIAYTAFNAIQSETVGYGTALAATTNYFYNSAKLLDHVVDPLGHTVATYGYDAQGRVTSLKDGDNVITTYQYDSLGRVSKVFDPTLTGTTNFTQYTYNGDDQVTGIATPTGTSSNTFDATTHRLASATDLNGNVTNYGYDPGTGALTSVTQIASGGNAVTGYSYNRLGELVLLTPPTGTATSFRYDADSRQVAMIEGVGAAPTAIVNPQTVQSSTQTVNVNASEPAVVASIVYWADGQPQSSGTTLQIRLDGNGGTGGTTYGQSAFAFNLTGIATGQLYHYQLTLTDRTGATQTQPPGILLAAPTSLTATAGSGQVALQWSTVSGATGYDIYRGTSPGGEGTTPFITGATGTSFTDTSVTNGMIYYYRVVPSALGAEGAASTEAVAAPSAAAPTLATFIAGDGTVQRSTVTSLTLKFSSPVTLAANALTLALHGSVNGGGPVGTLPTITWTTSDGGLTYLATFSGAGVTGSSIADGVYDLTLHSALIQDGNGLILGGGDQVLTFFRLYGDINGDASVNLTDYRQFKNAYLSSVGDSNYIAGFDTNGDGGINLTDYRIFKANYLLSFSY